MDITVVVPCYNSEKTLARCLDSLVSQSLEVLVYIINDGSTDRTLEIAEEYSGIYKNIKVFSQENKGLPQARKAGVQRITTKYTAFVDSDDWIEQDMMETLYRISEANNTEITACELYYERNGKSEVSLKSRRCKMIINGETALSLIHSRKAVYPFMWNKLFLTSFVQQLDFPSENFLGEDYITLSPSIENCKCIAVIDKPLYHYELKLGSMSKNSYGDAYEKGFLNYIAAYKKYEASHKFEQCKEMAYYLCVEFAAIYVAMIRNSNYDQKVVKVLRNFLTKHYKDFLTTENTITYKLSVFTIAKKPKVFNKLFAFYSRLQMRIGTVKCCK